jgi:sugar phosphate isomerase/epimerase
MRVGIGSYALTWAIGVPGYPAPRRPLDAVGLVVAAHDLGASFVQLCDNVPLDAMSDGALDGLHDAARAEGVALEVGTRGADAVSLLRFLDLARRLEARLVRTLVVEPGGQGLAAAERGIREAIRAYEEAGVTLAVENYEAHRAADLAALVRRIGGPSLGTCLDTVNSLGALEPPAGVITELLPLAASVHVKDFTVRRADHRMGFSVEGKPAGRGMLDIPELLAGARASGRDPGIVLELWTPWQGTIEETVDLERAWARESMSYLGRMKG